MANRISTVLDLDSKGWKANFQSILTDMGKADGLLGKLKTGWAGVTDSFKKSSTAQAAAVGGLLVVAQQSIKAASNLEESVNAVNVSYGQAAEGVHALGEDSATSFGLSQRAFNDFAVQFSAFANQIAKESGREVADIVNEMTTRVSDFASVMNLDVPEAAAIFQSALAGETEPIRRFGIDLSAAAVSAHAVETGMVDSAKEMTEATKVQARYSLLMQSTSKVQGDFAKTSDGLANATRIAAANFEDLQASLGKTLIPVVAEAVDTMNKLAESAEKVKTAFGLLPDPIEGTVGKLANYPGLMADAIEWQVKFPISAGKSIGSWFGIGESAEEASRGVALANAATESWLEAADAVPGLAERLSTAVWQNAEGFGAAAEAERDYVGGLQAANAEVRANQRALEDANWYIRQQADAAENASSEIDGLKVSHQELRDELADKSAYLDLQDAFDGVHAAAVEAYTAASEGADDAEQKLRDAERAQIDLKQRVLDYTDALGNIPPETTARIVALIDEGDLEAAELALQNLTRQRYADVLVRISGGTPTGDGGISFGGGYVARAHGGIVREPVTLVGERGPELVSLPNGSRVHTASETREMLGGVNIVQHFNTLAMNDEAARLIRRELERALREAR